MKKASSHKGTALSARHPHRRLCSAPARACGRSNRPFFRHLPHGPHFASDKVEIASEDITTGDIDGLFDGDFVLALTNPHITLKSNVKNASLDCSLSIEAENTSKKEATSSDFTLSTVSPNIWIGPLDPKTDAFKFVKNEKLPGIVQIVPQKIHLSLSADSKQWTNAPAGG